MAFDGAAMRYIANELKTLLLGGRIDKIYMPSNDTVVMAVRSLGKNYKLLLSCNPSLPRVYLTGHTRENPAVPPNFCMLLRKHLTSGRITAIIQPGIERELIIEAESRTELGDLEKKRLIFEIMGRHSNIILVNGDGRIADCVRHIDASVSSVRLVLPGLEYTPAPPQEKLSPLGCSREEIAGVINSCPPEKKIDKHILDSFAGLAPVLAREIVYRGAGVTDLTYIQAQPAALGVMADYAYALFSGITGYNFTPVIIFDDLGNPKDFSVMETRQYGNEKPAHNLIEYLDTFFEERERRGLLAQRGADMTKTVSNLLERYRRKSLLQKTSVKDAENAEKYRLFGDLITANIYRIEKGMIKIRLENYFDEALSEVDIELDPRLTPSQNAQKYYAKYAKMKKTAQFAKQQLKNTLADIEYLESIQTYIENCENLKELSEIKAELAFEGYVKRTDKKVKRKEEKTSEPAKYISADGFEILVGKNNRQNDYLTLKKASGRDIWLHTKNIPGSHTVIITEGRNVPDTTLVQAASLAAMCSRAKNSQNVAVDYTRIRYVKKPSGAKPGMVIYTDYQTLYVNPEDGQSVKKA